MAVQTALGPQDIGHLEVEIVRRQSLTDSRAFASFYFPSTRDFFQPWVSLKLKDAHPATYRAFQPALVC